MRLVFRRERVRLINIEMFYVMRDVSKVSKREKGVLVIANLMNLFQVIGRLELGGAKCTGSALHHWNEVCNSPRRQIADWHKLRE